LKFAVNALAANNGNCAKLVPLFVGHYIAQVTNIIFSSRHGHDLISTIDVIRMITMFTSVNGIATPSVTSGVLMSTRSTISSQLYLASGPSKHSLSTTVIAGHSVVLCTITVPAILGSVSPKVIGTGSVA
jgi:hypothetical protein